MGRIATGLLAISFALLLAPRARAGRLEPPRLESTLDVVYPTSAHGEAVVVLEIVVSATGRVDRADVVAGALPFVPG